MMSRGRKKEHEKRDDGKKIERSSTFRTGLKVQSGGEKKQVYENKTPEKLV